MRLFFLSLLILAAPARAGHVDASLLSARAAVRPGESFDAGLRLKIRDGWHVYWKNPGDSGLPPTLSWRLPPGWSAGAFSWPAPRRLETPPLTSFGYENEVVFPLTLSAPEDARPGARARLTAAAEWLECREICVPASARLSIPIAVENAPRVRAEAAAALAAARAQVPGPDPTAEVAASWDGSHAHLRLRLRGRHPRAEFFPYLSVIFENGRPPMSVSPSETEFLLTRRAGVNLMPTSVDGVLVRPGVPPAEISVPPRHNSEAARFILLAFAGGLLLNLMPCVFPVLAFKALGLLGRSGRDLARGRREALAYAGGTVLSCLALAGALIAARRAGAALGWGFQLQSPWVVGALAALFLGSGLGLLGVFEFGARWMGFGTSLSSRAGLIGSFFSGVFAMAAAAPCTAPFMGAALGWAATRPAAEALAVFASLGLGAAAPYACLSSWPALIRRLPRPGAWMDALKKVLSLPMFATCLWLLWVLWRLLASPAMVQDAVWTVWSPDAVAEARASGKTVFVDFTAAWCLNCQVNERAVLAAPAVRAALTRHDIAAFRADWTARDARISTELKRYGREGVPLYVVHPHGGEAVLLPELLTSGLILDALGVATLRRPR